MKIIKAGLQDFEVIHNLALRIWEPTYSKILSKEQLVYMFEMMYSREAFLSQTETEGHQYLLAELNGQYYGFASYQLNAQYGITKIHKLYVLPEEQRKQTGTKLLNGVIDIAKAHNNYKISLNVNRYNPAVHFYIKKGFINTGQEDINIGQGYLMEDYIMIKDI